MSKKPINSLYYQTTQSRFSRHQNKKPKKTSNEKEHKQLIYYIAKNQGQPLQNELPGHYKLGIWRKNMALLTRVHLPLYVKLLEVQQNLACIIPSKANINQKKNNKTDILIQDPQTQKTRLIKLNNFPILLAPQQMVFYQLTWAEFYEIFKSDQAKMEDIKRVYNFLVDQYQGYSNDCILWPSVILQQLNYQFEAIEQLASNFNINKSQNQALFQILQRNINQAQASISNPSNQPIMQSKASQQEAGQKIDAEPQKQIVSEQQPQVKKNDEQQKQVSQMIQQQTQRKNTTITQQKFCLWLIGTAQFTFTNKNIIPWNSFSLQNIKSIFTNTLCSNFIKQSNQIIDSLNKHKKLRQSELKGDQYKSFLYRLGYYKAQNQPQTLCIPLRFEYVKGTNKRILIKILRKQGTQLKWVTTQTTTVNYTLPILTKKQMSFLYLVNKISPHEIVLNFFYRPFLRIPEPLVSQIFLFHYPQFHITQKEAHYQRCKACHYVIRAMPFKCCFFCKVFSHQQCIPNIQQQQKKQKQNNNFFEQIFQNNGTVQMPWICQKCQPCSLCFEAVGEDFLFCSTCHAYSHFQCGRIKGLQENQSKMKNLKINDKYVCQFCLKCKMCSHKLKDNQYLLLQNDFYCSDCCQKIKSNNHCHICMKKKQGNSSMKWIQCGSSKCEKWVHEVCDPEYIGVVKSPTATDPYLCPFCRQVEKRAVYMQIIDCISVFDQAQFFTQPSYLDIPLYSTIISEPMCFQVMKLKAFQGKYDQDPIKLINADFQLIISNALKFNMPKDTAHVQAKILKILGQRALQKFKPLFKPELKALISGTTSQQIKRVKVQLHRQINNHYLQILLNYRAQKSYVQVKQSKRKPNDYKLQDQLKFRSAQILNNMFKNSTIIFHLKKQKVKIANLFTMPKSQNQIGVWHSIKEDICYFHNSKDIIFTCQQCGQSYCCMRQCLRHRLCSCGIKGCKCDDYQCGCTPIKEKQKKKQLEKKYLNKYGDPFKSEKDNLMDITQMYKNCLKCLQDKINTRTCAACEGLCSWGYFKCPDCSRVWHKACYPQLLQVSYVSNPPCQTTRPSYNFNQQSSMGSNQIYNRSTQNTLIIKLQPTSTCSINYCNQCLNNYHSNNYQQALTIAAKSKLVKIAKITRYMRIFIQVYFNQGIRLTPYEIQQLIFDNYDQFSIRQQLFKQYELNYNIIQRFRDFSFRTNAAIQRSFNQYVNDYEQIKKSTLLPSQNVQILTQIYGWKDKLSYWERSRNISRKYFNKWILNQQINQNSQKCTDLETCPDVYKCDWSSRFYLQTIDQIRQKIKSAAYSYMDFNSYKAWNFKNTEYVYDLLQDNAQSILNLKKYKKNNLNEMQEQHHHESFYSILEYKDYLLSLYYIPSVLQSYYKNEHRYRFTLIYRPRAMPFDYRLNPTFKKKSNLQQATKDFLIGIYQQSKFCLRKGTTCILKYSNGNKDTKDYWSVLKRWAKGKKEMQITLQKKMGLWVLKIDNWHEKIVYQIEEIINQINKFNRQSKITSFKELGQFLGFTIYQPLYKANHFTTFLQTHLVDQMPMLDKMNRITELYDSFTWGENGIFQRLAPAALANDTPTVPVNNQNIIPYQYSITKNKPPYLAKKQRKNDEKIQKNNIKKIQRRLSGFNGTTSNVEAQNSQANNTSSTDLVIKKHPFIIFEDLKRYLIDFSVLPTQIKSQISLKNNPILNQVFIAPSKIHKLGLFSRKNLKKHSIVIQYVGEIVSQSIADLREKKFHYGCYLFSILKENYKQNQDKKDIIDATFRGNMARYLNHSCDPNCKARTQYVSGSPRIIIYTIRDIQQFEEITYDYQFNVDAVQKLQCTCKAKNCQGRLN